ncbi:MAG TPA: molybdopterin-dependent oxidoreductase, partial [Polyangiales bacterium]
ATNSFDDIERARTILVCGANATENHPIVGARIRQAVLRGAQLIVIDPRRIELTQLGGVHLQLRPGSNVALLNAMAHVILREGLLDDSFVASRVDGLAELRAFVAAFPPERAAAVCGVSAESIEKAARLYATHKPAMCWHGLGMTEHVQGTESVMCLVNLALLTGNLGKPGSGVNPLRGQNNVQGAAHMGCEPAHLPGYATLDNGRELFERHWQAPLPTTAGLDLMQMMDAAQAGRLKALYAIGYDVLLTNPNTNVTREALRKLPLVIVQDIFLTETAREFAHVVLPAAASYEKEGTFMNGERRVQRVRKAVQAPGHARADWEIVCALASQLGQRQGFAFRSAEEVWDEVRRVWKAGAGMSYARLDRAGLQWPCPSEDHPGTALLHADSFSLGVRAALRCIDYRPTSEVCDERYPLLLITGRRLHHFNAGTMTGRTRNHELRPPDMLELCAQDAAQHGLHEGERVVVRSRHGSASLPVHIDDAARPGELFTTFHTAQVFLNHVTGPHRDNVTRAPEYKVTAVALERAAQPAVAG